MLGGELRQAVGGRLLALPGRSLGEVLDALACRGGSRLAKRLFADPDAEAPSPHPDLRLLVNGRNARFLDGLDTLLDDEDAVTVHLAGARSFPGG